EPSHGIRRRAEPVDWTSRTCVGLATPMLAACTLRADLDAGLRPGRIQGDDAAAVAEGGARLAPLDAHPSGLAGPGYRSHARSGEAQGRRPGRRPGRGRGRALAVGCRKGRPVGPRPGY